MLFARVGMCIYCSFRSENTYNKFIVEEVTVAMRVHQYNFKLQLNGCRLLEALSLIGVQFFLLSLYHVH